MKNILFFLILILSLFGGCAIFEEEEHNPSRGGSGKLIRKGYPNEINPFFILKETADYELQPVYDPMIIKEDVSDYFPLKMAGLGYVLSAKVSAKHYTEEEYVISLRTLTNDRKDCSEVKEVTFYRIGEENGIAEYRSRKSYKNYEGVYEGVYMFFAQRELPSYDWYNVLKVCEGKYFRLEGVVL